MVRGLKDPRYVLSLATWLFFQQIRELFCNMIKCAMTVFLLLDKVEERRNIVLHNKGIYDNIEREDTIVLRTNVKNRNLTMTSIALRPQHNKLKPSYQVYCR